MRRFFLVGAMATACFANITNFANNAIMELDSSTTMNTRDRTILHGGGFTLRTPNTHFQPFNVQAPSVKAGCGGIDMTFGSLSFLDSDQFSAFAQNILAAAPGVAFDLALKTLCPSCADTLGKLHAMANQINQMGMGSCQAATALGKAVEGLPMVQSAMETSKQNQEGSYLSSFNKTVLESANDSLVTFNRYLNEVGGCTGPGCKQLKFLTESDKKSMLDYMLSDANVAGIDTASYLSAFRAMMGDVIKQKIPEEEPGQLGAIPSIDGYEFDLSFGTKYYEVGKMSGANKENTEKLIKRMMGENIEAKVRDHNEGTSLASFNPSGLSENFKTRIVSIAEGMEARQSLSSNNVNFLQLFRDPIYKIFNMYATTPEGISYLRDVISEPLAKMLAAEFIYEYIQSVRKYTVEYAAKYESATTSAKGVPYANIDESVKWAKDIASNASKAAHIAYGVYFENYTKYSEAVNKKTSVFESAQKLKNFTLARNQPDLFANYMYGKSVGGK